VRTRAAINDFVRPMTRSRSRAQSGNSSHISPYVSSRISLTTRSMYARDGRVIQPQTETFRSSSLCAFRGLVNQGCQVMRLDGEQTVGRLHPHGPSTTSNLCRESLLGVPGAEMLDDRIREHDVEGSVCEREVRAVSLHILDSRRNYFGCRVEVEDRDVQVSLAFPEAGCSAYVKPAAERRPT
jgi:hypothetical protein